MYHYSSMWRERASRFWASVRQSRSFSIPTASSAGIGKTHIFHKFLKMEKDTATIDTYLHHKAYIRLLIFAAPDIFVFVFFGPIWLFQHFGLPTSALVYSTYCEHSMIDDKLFYLKLKIPLLSKLFISRRTFFYGL